MDAYPEPIAPEPERIIGKTEADAAAEEKDDRELFGRLQLVESPAETATTAEPEVTDPAPVEPAQVEPESPLQELIAGDRYEQRIGVDGTQLLEIVIAAGLHVSDSDVEDLIQFAEAHGLHGPEDIRAYCAEVKRIQDDDAEKASREARLAALEERLGELPGSPTGDAIARLNARLDRMEEQERETQEMAEAEARAVQEMDMQSATHAATFEAAWTKANQGKPPMDKWVGFMSQLGPAALAIPAPMLAQLAMQTIGSTALGDGSTVRGRGRTASRTIPGTPIEPVPPARPEQSLTDLLSYYE